MGELPIHPGVVHLPIGIVFVLPFLLSLYIIFFKKKLLERSGFVIILVLYGLLTISSVISIKTGENEISAVKNVVAQQHVNTHENEAQNFLVVTLLALVTGISTLVVNSLRYFQIGLIFNFFIQILLIYFAIQVGHTGGVLVYKYSATDAYLPRISNE
ncbi:MAG: hypothetical protein HON90_01910 [Halobacteriovoraceae bacterium]|jgi:uncharacterized membrane protein|nr:hypothetical protein [Halobacteriovoraceae bacterium]